MPAKNKPSDGNFLEIFNVGQGFRYAIPRKVTAGDVALDNALSRSRLVFDRSDPFAQCLRLGRAPLTW